MEAVDGMGKWSFIFVRRTFEQSEEQTGVIVHFYDDLSTNHKSKGCVGSPLLPLVAHFRSFYPKAKEGQHYVGHGSC